MSERSDWVVVVDDDVMSLKNARELLNSPDLKISAVRSGADLLAFMEKNQPDLILLDVLMPEMDGFETLQKLRAFEESTGLRSTPVIFLTGENDTETERRGLKLGASDFIRKPFNREILIHRIQNTINNNRTIESLTEEASTDQLTGMLNKASGTARVEEACQSAAGALMIIDLDSFKLVNDIYGHEMGDKVLISFADIVRQSSRTGDILSRIGGDEFLAFYRRVADESAVASLTRRINHQLTGICHQLMGEDFNIPIGASIGCVLIPQHGRDYQTLFSWADKALYQVKQNGKHGFMIHNPFEETQGEDALDLDGELSRMIQILDERGEGNEAMWVGQEAFTWIHRFNKRFLNRYESVETHILFLLSSQIQGGEVETAVAEEQFGDLLKKSLRKSDVIMQARSDRYLVLLPGLAEGNVNEVAERIVRTWRQTAYGDRFEVRYSARSVAHQKGQG